MFPHPLVLYTHWRGSDIRQTLQSALKRGQERWEDPSYLARIIFCALIGSDSGITGFGLSTTVGDGQHNLLCVDVDRQIVF